MRPLYAFVVPLSLGCSGLFPASSEVKPGEPIPIAISSQPVPLAQEAAPPSEVPVVPPANVPGSISDIAREIVTAECAPPPFTEDVPAVPAPGRQAEVEAFLVANPQAAAMPELLVDWLTGGQNKVEVAFPAVVAELAAEPVELPVSKADYQGVVVLNWAHNTTDDWAYFSHHITVSLEAAGVPAVQASPFQRKVNVVGPGAPPEGVDLSGLQPIPTVGYAVIMAGKPPVFVEHSLPDDVARQISEIVGKPIPLAAGL